MKEKIILLALLSLACANFELLPWQYPPDYCKYCQQLMNLTIRFANDTKPFTTKKMKNALGNLCSLIKKDPDFRATCFVIYDNAAKVVAWYHAGIVKPDVYCVKLNLCHNDQIKKKKQWLKKLNRMKNAFKPNSVLNTFQENFDPVKSSGFGDVVMKKFMPVIHLMKPHDNGKDNHRNKTRGNPGRHHHGHHRQHRHRHHQGHRRHGGHYEEHPTERIVEKFFFKFGKVPFI